MRKQEFQNEVDMLKGNICRICVSDSAEEIGNMCDFAIKRLLKIKKFRLDELKEEK